MGSFLSCPETALESKAPAQKNAVGGDIKAKRRVEIAHVNYRLNVRGRCEASLLSLGLCIRNKTLGLQSNMGHSSDEF